MDPYECIFNDCVDSKDNLDEQYRYDDLDNELIINEKRNGNGNHNFLMEIIYLYQDRLDVAYLIIDPDIFRNRFTSFDRYLYSNDIG